MTFQFPFEGVRASHTHHLVFTFALLGETMTDPRTFSSVTDPAGLRLPTELPPNGDQEKTWVPYLVLG
jgi:hypothetical protein